MGGLEVTLDLLPVVGLGFLMGYLRPGLLPQVDAPISLGWYGDLVRCPGAGLPEVEGPISLGMQGELVRDPEVLIVLVSVPLGVLPEVPLTVVLLDIEHNPFIVITLVV